jgi:hypothetical protein
MNIFSPSLQPQTHPHSLSEEQQIEWINLKLSTLGLPTYGDASQSPVIRLCDPLLAEYREKCRQLGTQLCPVDQRIQDFLENYFKDCSESIARLPSETLVLDVPGMAATLSLPPEADEYTSPYIRSNRVSQGVIHNPVSDRRTTAGVFHVCEGGIPVPRDKSPVPKITFLRLLQAALTPPESLLELPFTSTQEQQARCMVSLMLRPLISPAVPGITHARTMEIRFFAPGSLVSNLDFVERIFGNAGDPNLPENNAALSPDEWTGHTGCVILAPHLTQLRKKDLGLPHFDQASEWQRQAGMCWKKEDELYNEGRSFKVTCRDTSGVIVTLIADNYFGYCKKEVKTQITYACNLYGMTEEEHAGGTYVFPSYELGEEFTTETHIPMVDHTWEEMVRLMGSRIELHPEGYARDKQYQDIYYLPESARVDLHEVKIQWANDRGETTIPLQPGHTYIFPSGYKVEMIKPGSGRRWRLIGTVSEPTFCHKPCTVSGGGKSEISKPISDAILHGHVYIQDFNQDFAQVREILEKDFSDRFHPHVDTRNAGRPILSPSRSLGSVIKLLTPSSDYKDEYNEWLNSIPSHIRELVFIIKRLYKPNWGEDWLQRFSVDWINGQGGHELKYRDQKILSSFLRLGFTDRGNWRTFGLRKDFFPARKIQAEDDISVSIVLPGSMLKNLNPRYPQHSYKFVENCERRFFQRPDEAIVRGYDKQTEKDFSEPGNFLSNFEPLNRAQVSEMVTDILRFEQFTEPMQKALRQFLASESPQFVACSANPRLVDGKPSKNPRYLQKRSDWEQPRELYLAEVGLRLYRRLPWEEPIALPVNAILPGRRNNPPDRKAGIPPLATFNPIHYLELPELFMEFIASLTGKSPSTTGAGSEGALTKAPFNALPSIIDLNNALVSALLTGQPAFISSAGYIGPHYRVEHDISLVIPEVWSRMTPEERNPEYLIRAGFLEKCEDRVFNGKKIESSRMGWRINESFVNAFFGRVFNNPNVIFNKEILRPELQDEALFAEGIETMVETERQVATLYFQDGTIAGACPPLRALLHIMKDGHYNGKGIHDPEIRSLFTQEYLLSSDWYRLRLQCRIQIEIKLYQKFEATIENLLQEQSYRTVVDRLGLSSKLQEVRQHLARLREPDAWKSLHGTIGADPWVHMGHPVEIHS